ncbi:MAG: ChaN family lipoprotein [Alphaproteobacteria bacterium]|nr:ChaN family lipoprotein [Alphaproteobacteria bacterium]
MQSFHKIILACLSLTVLSACVTTPPPKQADLACPAPGQWLDISSGKVVSGSQATRALSTAQIVLLGETHTRAEQHQWQLHTLAGLYGKNSALGVGFEMFPRSSQGALDQWVAGEVDRASFLEKSKWGEVWQYNSDLYAPLLDFVRQNKITSHGINVDRTLIKAVSENGWQAVPTEKREGVSDPAPAIEGYKALLFSVYQEHLTHRGKDSKTATQKDEGFLRFVQSQLTWDRAMAEKLAEMVRSPDIDQAVGIIGSGHLANGYGVSHQLEDLGITNTAIAIPMDKANECQTIGPGFADLVFVTEPMVKAEEAWKPMLGVLLELSKSGVRAVKVLDGSVGQKAGLKEGDIFKSIAGTSVSQVKEAITIVRRQAPGTWLPLVMERKGETLPFIAKFPIK